MNKKPTQNKHLEHPCDEILMGNLSVLDWMCETNSTISVKIDGSPSLVWGRNPANGKFFVGTKSVFNKVKIKINHSHEEIDTNHQGKVADILHACFDSLPRTKYIYQGDFIGFGGDDTYRPNTITYKFPEVIEQSVIVAPHTEYTCEDDLRNAIAQPITKRFVDTYDVKWVQPEAEICPHLDDIEDFCKFAKQMSTLCTFVSNKQAAELKKIINSYIREGKDVDEHEIAENYDVDINLLRFWKLVESIKMDLFFFISNDDSISCEIDGNESEHEGFVMNNRYGTYKIVDRQTFSRLNFTLPKVW
jgi:hypothetical protein